jgi:hypothetical protein
MLKRYVYVFTVRSVNCYDYVGVTDGNACVVYVWYGIIFISARSIQNSEFSQNASVCSVRITPFQSCFNC